ncbi:selenate reductase subunit YgfN [Escherichia coli]|uniref:Selenate reductase subunit YgfN n=1 Tax=Escherichia coli TaxID=562 RepID=A0A377C1A5_ECOLX|nr:selenate reductase subunit YgfN [Escherichia coli]
MAQNFAEVAVNTRTGEIRLDKFYALLDCGTPVNPELALGQIYGATLRAIGPQYERRDHL